MESGGGVKHMHRLFVNRIWQAYFGTGIVATAEDFGTQSEPPSHRDLLDWLACEFMDSGWSIKHMHRLIVTSATYRQSSRVTPDVYAKDPYNRLLARGARFRVGGGVGAGWGAAGQWIVEPEDGRAERQPARAGVFVSAARQLRALPVGG